MSEGLSILKPLWTRRLDGAWAIHGMKGIDLKPKAGFEPDYFAFESDLELMTNSPPKNLGDLFSSFGTTDFLLKESIVPVVAWVTGEKEIRVIGTAFVVSASGFVVTASHVLLDPYESGYSKLIREEGQPDRHEGLMFGVIIPINAARAHKSHYILPFEQGWYWGEWRQSPMIHETDKLHSLTDVAICKLPPKHDGSAYQALNLSLNPFALGEGALTIGYAEMKNIPVDSVEGKPVIGDFEQELYVSCGTVRAVYPDNHAKKDVPTPGPAFDFEAKVPGRMSGAPIFGAKGAVIRGVVSRSFQDEKHATGCMIGPVMTLEFSGGVSLKKLMDRHTEGLAVVKGQGL